MDAHISHWIANFAEWDKKVEKVSDSAGVSRDSPALRRRARKMFEL
jgi:hypothetical protein